VEGALTGYVSGQVSSEQFTLTLAMQFLAIVIVGGLDSIWGAVIGAAIFVALPYLTKDVVSSVLGAQQASQNGANYGVIVYAVIVVIFIVAAPRGLVGLIRDTGRKAWHRARGPLANRRAASARPGADG
jgi:branched-chain amino acid transport system permease protein